MYYINNGNENGGPFTLEELTTSSCTNNLVWQQGMEDWQYAIDCRTKISLSKNQNAYYSPLNYQNKSKRR
jgi:hypothetical protein